MVLHRPVEPARITGHPEVGKNVGSRVNCRVAQLSAPDENYDLTRGFFAFPWLARTCAL
jgi:hypothetical protein